MLPHDREPERDTLILVSNREPYEHSRIEGRVEVQQPAGGLVSALDPTMARLRGTWVAWGSGSADRSATDAHGYVAVPPEDPRYTLRRIWLDEQDVARYYHGFSNSVLWPLCHGVREEIRFARADWARYADVNRRFGDAVLQEAERAAGTPIVWVQDYHLALLPRLARAQKPELFIHQFWHVPFPGPDVFSELPENIGRRLLEGLLGNDLFELQTERDVWNFLSCVYDLVPDVRITRGKVTHRDGRTSHVRAFPISIDVTRYEQLASSAETADDVAALRATHAAGACQLAVCVDRADYTKGILERLDALELLWSSHPELRERVSFVFVATPSRSELASYARLEERIAASVARVNARFGTRAWRPVTLVSRNLDAKELAVLYRAADVCLISSLADGMNLVAKEFIACQLEERGVLVLSRHAGAAERLHDAVLIDPFSPVEFAATLQRALVMPLEERRARMQRLRADLRLHTIEHWLEDVNDAVAELRGMRAPIADDTLILRNAATRTTGPRATGRHAPPPVVRRGRDPRAARTET